MQVSQLTSLCTELMNNEFQKDHRPQTSILEKQNVNADKEVAVMQGQVLVLQQSVCAMFFLP